MENLLVSVIIPCYNVEKYLKDAVESVLHQTYRDIEIILVDDGSTDSTAEQCDFYAETYRNVCVIHKENGGLSSARNKGMQVAKGEYIYFLDADDFIKDTALEYLVGKMEENNAEVVFFGSCSVNESGKIIESNKREFLSQKIFGGKEAYELFLNEKVYAACVQFYLYRKSFLETHGLKFFVGVIYEDELFSFEVYQVAERMLIEQEQFYYKRVRDKSIMSSKENGEQKFESVTWITDKVTSAPYLKKISKKDSRNLLRFLLRIFEHLSSRFNEFSCEQKKRFGKSYRSCLKKYILLAIFSGQFMGISICLRRYALSFYLSRNRKTDG